MRTIEGNTAQNDWGDQSNGGWVAERTRYPSQIRGFISSDFLPRRNEFVAHMSLWLARGMIQTRYTVFEGLERGPEAFLSLFSGGNTGKALVRVEA